MGNHAGIKLDYKQEISDDGMDRAKAEYTFGERLYEILLDYQNRFVGRKPYKKDDKIGELTPQMSHLYNLIWASAIGLNDKGKSKKKQQVEVIA